MGGKLQTCQPPNLAEIEHKDASLHKFEQNLTDLLEIRLEVRHSPITHICARAAKYDSLCANVGTQAGSTARTQQLGGHLAAEL